MIIKQYFALAIRQVLLACLFSLSLANLAHSADIEDAADAMEREDYETAIVILQPLAEAGDVAAQFKLGQAYELLHGDDVYSMEAYVWYHMAAQQGHKEAQSIIDSFYDFDPSLEGLLKAAKRGNEEAQIQLGIAYFNGDGVEQDYDKAAFWFQTSFEDAYSRTRLGRVALGVMYHTGRGVPQDYVRACYLFEDSSYFGELEEPYRFFEREPVSLMHAKPDFGASTAWLREAAGDGNPDAQFCLAIAYFKGLVVEQSKEEAIQWLTQSAEGGNTRGQYYLGSIYWPGDAVSFNDPEKAAYWLEKAALKEHPDAQTSLGALYLSGEGVEMDREKGEYWLRRAVENGAEGADYLLGLLEGEYIQ